MMTLRETLDWILLLQIRFIHFVEAIFRCLVLEISSADFNPNYHQKAFLQLTYLHFNEEKRRRDPISLQSNDKECLSICVVIETVWTRMIRELASPSSQTTSSTHARHRRPRPDADHLRDTGIRFSDRPRPQRRRGNKKLETREIEEEDLASIFLGSHFPAGNNRQEMAQVQSSWCRRWQIRGEPL